MSKSKLTEGDRASLERLAKAVEPGDELAPVFDHLPYPGRASAFRYFRERVQSRGLFAAQLPISGGRFLTLWLPKDPTLQGLLEQAQEDSSVSLIIADWLEENGIKVSPKLQATRAAASVQMGEKAVMRLAETAVREKARADEATRRIRQSQAAADKLAEQSIVMVDVWLPALHPLAELFPAMSDEEYVALKESIALSKRIEPLKVVRRDEPNVDIKVVDGRHRLKAVRDIGWDKVPCQVVTDDETLLPMVVALNLHRRHLTQSQKAMMADKIAEYLEGAARERQREAAQRGGQKSGEARREKTKVAANLQQPSPPDVAVPSQSPVQPQRTAELAAESVGVSPRMVYDAKAIRRADPSLAEQVKDGKKTINAAKKEIERRERHKQAQARGEVSQGVPLPRELTAYHEAGHAVIGYLFGADVESVSIKPKPGDPRTGEKASLGCYAPDREAAEAIPAWQRAVLTFAGPLAEAKYQGAPHRVRGTDREQLAGHILYDLPKVRFRTGAALGCFAGTDWNVKLSNVTRAQYREWLLSMTRDLLDDDPVWRAVRQLAEELLRKDEMAGPEAIKAIEQYVIRQEPHP